MTAATSFGTSYQRFKCPLQSLPFSSFSSQARCFGLRVLIFGVAAVSSAMESFLQTVVTEKCFQCAARVAQLCSYAAGKFKSQEGIRSLLQFAAITIPPRLFAARQPVDVNVLGLHHFEQSCAAMRAAPAAQSTSAVRCLRNSKIADGVIHHDGARTQLSGESHSPRAVFRPDACSKGKGRIVCPRNRLFCILYTLNRQDRAKSFF